MAKKTEAEKAAAEAAAAEEARRQTEQKRMKWAGVFLAALALFAGGYAVGQAAEDDTTVAGDRFVFGEEFPPFFDDYEIPDDFDLPRDRAPGRFDVPRDFPCRIIERDGPGMILRCEFGGEFDFPGRTVIPFDECPPRFEGDCPWLDDEGDTDDPGVVDDESGFLGVGIANSRRGIRVIEVMEGSSAAEAGIELGDVILEFDGVAVESTGHLADLIAGAGAGTEVEIVLLRFDGEVTVAAVLGSPPQ
jgi:membrane-associated protease RseP (regulator of RpoE activity)